MGSYLLREAAFASAAGAAAESIMRKDEGTGMNDENIRELKVEELENVAGGGAGWENIGGPLKSVIWGNLTWADICVGF
jgi:hypothetical protein